MNKYQVEKNAELVYRLRGLPMAANVLHIGAHPDDEDVGLLAYLSCKFGVHTTYWSATRGEGGQNRIGRYHDEALGIYRTWESMAARSVDRGDCLFGPFYDFGYCKNAKEALAKWGQENLVREVVRAIRLTQPHVLVMRWSGTQADFHGHHQAVGLAAIEAFGRAGDSAQFPELKAQGLAPWQPFKIYQSQDNSREDLSAGGALNLHGQRRQDLERQGILRINTGEFDPIAGRTYQERAWMAYNRHQTQGMGMAPEPGDFFYYFPLLKSLAPVPDIETSLFDGLDPTLTALADYPGNGSPVLRDRLEEAENLAKQSLLQYRVDAPKASSRLLQSALLLLRHTLEGIKKADLNTEAEDALSRYLKAKIKDFEYVCAKCLGLELECVSECSRINPGQKFRVSTRLWDFNGWRPGQSTLELSVPDGWKVKELGQKDVSASASLEADFEVMASEESNLSCPYWLVSQKEPYSYKWPEGEPCGRAFAPPILEARCRVVLGEDEICLSEPVVFREAFPGGFRELTPAVIPPISLHPEASFECVPVSDNEQYLELHVMICNNSCHSVGGELELLVPSGWKVSPGAIDISLNEPGETKTQKYRVNIPPSIPADAYKLRYRMQYRDRDYTDALTPVQMELPGLLFSTDGSNCIKEEFILTPSEVTIHSIDVRFVKDLKYAYVQGAQEGVLDALKHFGISFQLLSDSEMGFVNLDEFDAVLIGPNAYPLREKLRKHASRFLDYVEHGGTLIVQYQGYGYQDGDFVPHPFHYNQPHDRVTNEQAPVKILDPEHVLFRLPNVIGERDFDGWLHDRGLYFFGQWDKRYKTLLSCADHGEEPHEGGLVECQYGRGTFLYAAYSFFRQLPAGVPGAFRLFANIIALPEARILERIEFLKRVPLFSFLKEEELDMLARIIFEKWERQGCYLCRQGDIGNELYIVSSGEVETVKVQNNVERIVSVAGQGEYLGEIALLGEVPRTASLRARTDIQLLAVRADDFFSLVRRHPDMAIKVMKLLVQRIVSAEARSS